MSTTRVTVIDPVSLGSEEQAGRWLGELDPQREIDHAIGVLDRVLLAYRISTADPYIHEVSASQALTLRAGWGRGEEVADGLWTSAKELSVSEPRKHRVSALRPQERFAVLLSARGEALACEEFALRARLDLDQSRIQYAAFELERAYQSALQELPLEDREDLAERLGELKELQETVKATAAALSSSGPELSHTQSLTHALGRLEATLRARSAAGFESR